MRFTLKQTNQLLSAVSHAQAFYIRGDDADATYRHVLDSFLELAASEFGFIGQVHRREDGSPYLKTQAISNIAWNEETRALLTQQSASGLEFARLDSLFGAVLLSGKLVISNNPESDPRSGGLPPGHAHLHAFMGLPVHVSGALVGVIAVANRKGGYNEDLAQFLQPLVNTYGQLISVTERDREWSRLQAALDASHKNLQALVAEREEQIAGLSRFIEQLSNPVITTDDRLVITAWNRGAERVFGHREDVAIGQALDLIFDPGAVQPDIRSLALLPGDSTNREFASQFRHASGKTVFAHLSLTFVRGKDQSIDHVICNIVDNSAEQAALSLATESESRYRNLFNLSPDAILVLQGSVCIDCNQAAVNMFGYSNREAMLNGNPGESFLPLQPDGTDSNNLMNHHLQQAAESGFTSFKFFFRRAKGENFPAEVRIAPIPMVGNLQFQVSIRDISSLKQAQRQLQIHRQLLEEILENLPVAVFVKDVTDEFRYILTNRKFAEVLFSDSKKNILGATDFEIMEFSNANSIRQQDLEIARTGQPFENPEDLIQYSTDERLYVRTQKTLLRDSAGMPSLILGVSEDITERKEVEKALKSSERRFRELAASAPVGIFLTDPRGACIYVNEQWEKISGLNVEQAAGEGWINGLHADDVAAVTEMWQMFIEGKKEFALDYRFVCPNGRVNWVAGKAVAFRNEDDQVVGFLASATDVTRSKQFEQDLQISRDEAERANAAKSEFLSRMSHELRTPLNAVLGFGQLMQMGDEKLTALQNSQVDQILAGGEHLLELIEDVLDFSRIDSGHMSINLKRFPLAEALQAAVSLVSRLSEKEHVRIIPPAADVADVIADPRRTQQVLVNLLSNAIKYNSAGGTVTVSASTLPDHMVRISVEDNGRGIRPENWARLFEPFERVAEPYSSVEGTGIGLSICKKLAELMGGSIGFDSEFGVGSTFWLDLAAAPATISIKPPTGDAEISALLTELGHIRILYVEDDLASVRLMTEVARIIPGCEFVSASNVKDGVALARSSRPNLILMDINLPGLGGFEALQMLRNDSRTCDIPVIALSASASPELIERGRAAGFTQFLTKPIMLDGLFRAIATAHRPSA